MSRGLAGIIYGKDGMGKTSLGLRFPGPVFCKSIFENGYLYLSDVPGNIPDNTDNQDIRTWQELVAAVKATKTGTILIDSLKGLQKILFDYVCTTYYKSDWTNFNSYSSGARKESVAVLQTFLDLCSQKNAEGVHTVFLGHMGTSAVTNAMGADYVSHVISMEDGDKGRISSTIRSWAGFIFFLNLQIVISVATETDRAKNIVEGKADARDTRWIFTTTSLVHQAKNRWNMPNQIPMGRNADEAWANLSKHIPQAYLKKGQPVS